MKFITRLFCFALGAVLLAFSAKADTQATPNYFTNITGIPALITTAGNSNVNSGTLTNTPVSVNPGYGFAIAMQWTNALSTATSNATLFVNFSVDGTNWPSPPLLSCQFTHQTGTVQWQSTNLTGTLFDGFRQMRIESISNNDSVNTISNIQVVISRRRLDYNQLAP